MRIFVGLETDKGESEHDRRKQPEHELWALVLEDRPVCERHRDAASEQDRGIECGMDDALFGKAPGRTCSSVQSAPNLFVLA